RALMGANGVSVAMSGNPSNYYIASAIIAYATGIQYGNIFYAGHGEQVNVLLSFNNSGYQLTGYSISWGSLEGTALTGDDDAYVLTVGNQYNPIVMPVTTPTLSTFIFDSQTNSDNNNWNNVENWNQQQLPTSNDNVYILSSVTIPSGCVAAANEITIANDSKITIEDGGQLQHNNAGVEATMQKNITKYTGDKDNYNLMALPFTSYNVAGSPLVTSSETGFAYDLYTFDGTQDKEWRVVDATTGIINNGTGFLYANNMGGIISMTGTLVASNEAVEMTLNYDGTTDFGAWNLVGNPFACNATPNITDFYVIGGENNDEVVATTNGTVAPLAGIFVQASSEVQSVRFTKAETSKAASALTMCLSEASVRSDKLIDRAIVRFDESRGLEKFQLNPNHTRLYIPQGGNDYAVVHSEGVGELPVSFKAEKNGTYTLTSSKDNVEFSYLHLIDNMTGTNIDLLAQPSYSFEASTTDYANRFKLVFATGASSDAESSNFGFVNGMGNFVIFGIDGEATLQVIDMMGHVLSSEQFSGSYKKHLDVAAGIYVLRLINGNDVKAQKIVIR
nr:T9SS type A sorting domain-containing protein [Bacteroidales bacterium]